MKTIYVTQEGLDKMKAELNHLVKHERPAIAQQLAEARDKGDLSENAEYDAAKEAQGIMESKIAQLKIKIVNARVIDEKKLDNSKVGILSKVKIKNLKNNATVEYLLVPEGEADLSQGKLAISSPIGKALLSKKTGDTVEVKVPAGIMNYEVLSISR